MRLILPFLVLLSWSLTKASVMVFKSDNAPPGYCYLAQYDLLIREGEYVTKVGGDCNKFQCSYPKVYEYGCPTVQIMDPNGKTCTAAKDLRKPYPECCQSEKCV